jgi:hypothetical protein
VRIACLKATVAYADQSAIGNQQSAIFLTLPKCYYRIDFRRTQCRDKTRSQRNQGE